MPPRSEWERCRPWIEAAINNQAKRTGFVTHTIRDVGEQVARGEAVFWPFERSAAVTEVIPYPQVKVLHLWLCGGEWSDMEQHLPRVLEWGRGQGCQWATTAGRRGWDRVMAKHGFVPLAHVCGREI